MFKIGNQGTFETLPDHAMAIYKGDVIAVEDAIGYCPNHQSTGSRQAFGG